MAKIRQGDIARDLHLSSATVSRVLNRSPLVTKEKRDLVISYLKEHGFSTEEYGIRDVKGPIVFAVPSLENIFYSPLIASARRKARDYGYTLLAEECTITDENTDEYIEHLKAMNASAFITSNSLSPEAVERINSAIPSVCCGESVAFSSVPYVTIDDEGGSFSAVRYLLSIGRRRIAFINGPKNYKYARSRELGYISALRLSSIEVNDDLMANVGEDMNIEDGEMIASSMLSGRIIPDAFFVISDVIASAVEKVILKRGFRIPEDIAVVGFDDSIASSIASVPLTTVRQPVEKTGEIAAKMAVSLINGESVSSIVLGTELIIRDSTLSNCPSG